MGEGHVVIGARGFVFLAGNTAAADDYDPFKKGGGAVEDAAAQWRNILTNIKVDLEELGTSLEHLIRLTFFVKGPFPDGGVLSSPNFRQDVMDEFLLRIAQGIADHARTQSRRHPRHSQHGTLTAGQLMTGMDAQLGLS